MSAQDPDGWKFLLRFRKCHRFQQARRTSRLQGDTSWWRVTANDNLPNTVWSVLVAITSTWTQHFTGYLPGKDGWDRGRPRRCYQYRWRRVRPRINANVHDANLISLMDAAEKCLVFNSEKFFIKQGSISFYGNTYTAEDRSRESTRRPEHTNISI